MPIDTSKDILNLAIAFAVVFLSIFLAWLLYYFIIMARQMFQITKEMRERINKIDEAVKSFKEKFDHGSSYLILISEGIKKLVEIVKERNEKKTRKKKSK
jgi:predicted PurR-regulated permease PerM